MLVGMARETVLLETDKLKLRNLFLFCGRCHRSLFVTFDTLDLSVFTAKRIARHFVSKFLDLPARLAVASEALAATLEFRREVLPVLVFMAREAILLQARELKEAKTLRLNSGCLFVTIQTLNLEVFSAKSITRLLVIEILNLPAGFCVALKTLAAALKLLVQILTMLIGVTCETLGRLQIFPFVENRFLRLRPTVAIEAFQFKVLTFELVAAIFFVIKFEICFPLFQTVASAAILLRIFAGEEMDVVLLMAAHARGLLAQKAHVRFSQIFFDSFGLVTLYAIDLGVFALENVASFRMVVGFDIDLRRIVVSTFVLRVTFNARLLGETVKARFCIDKFFDLFVASHAQSLIDTLAGIMTLQTISSLEVLMPLDQRSRGEHPIHDAFTRVSTANRGRRKK